MNTDQDYDNDGNNIVPCPICLSAHCPSKEGGKCPEESNFLKAMDEKELEKLVEEFYEMRDQNGTPIGEFILKNGETIVEISTIKEALLFTLNCAADLADKQGYMRGVEEALKCLPEKRTLKGNDAMGSGQGMWNAAISQAHDTISKLKEV